MCEELAQGGARNETTTRAQRWWSSQWVGSTGGRTAFLRELGTTLSAARGGGQVDDGESILEAALDDGLDVPHDCKMGVCMTCPAKLVSGEVDHGIAMLSDEVIAQGFTLLCTAIPLTDVTIQVIEEDDLLDLQLDGNARV